MCCQLYGVCGWLFDACCLLVVVYCLLLLVFIACSVLLSLRVACNPMGVHCVVCYVVSVVFCSSCVAFSCLSIGVRRCSLLVFVVGGL